VPGTYYYNRVGTAIVARDVQAFFQLQGGQANGVLDDRNNTVRIIVCTGPAGLGAPAFANFSVSNANDTRFFPGVHNILYDRRYSLQSPGRDSTGYMPAVLETSFHFRLNLPVVYSANAVNSNNVEIYLVAVSDSSAASHPFITNGAFLVSYTDC